MTIKLVAFDMDGTFLNDQNTYNHGRFAELLAQLRAKGIRVAAASGSQYQRLVSQFADFRDQMDFISQNGAVVYSNGKLIGVTAMTPIDVVDTLTVIKRRFTTQDIAEHLVAGLKSAYVDDQVSQNSYNTTARYYSSLRRVPNLEEMTPETLGDQITCIGLTFRRGVDFTTITRTLRMDLPKRTASQTSGFNTALISESTVNKAAGLRRLQALYGIADNEVMTFGDNENDLSMLEMTPYGYAMANAVPSVKARVKHFAKSNNDEGVLDVLATLI